MLRFRLLTTIFLCATFSTVRGQWTKLTTVQYADMDVNDVYANGSNIFAVGYRFSDFAGHIIRSTNNGQNWDTLQPYGPGKLLKTIAFKDKDTGYIGGFGSITVMLQTTDGGANWKPHIADPANAGINDMQFLNDKIGFASGYAYKQFNTGQVYRTTDGGGTWYYIDSVDLGCLDTLPVDYVQFVDAQTGYGHSDFLGRAYIVKTVDSGKTWNLLYTHPTMFTGFHFTNVNDGILVDLYDKVYKTTDGGKNWTLTTSSGITGNPILISMDFMNQTTGVLVGDAGAIYKTTDGGKTWTKETSPVNATYLRVRFYDNRAYAVARGGHVVRSEVIPNNVSEVLSLREQLNVYPNPANDMLNISSYRGAYKNIEVKLLDMTGKIVQEANTQDGLVRINTADIPAGVYNIQISANGHECSDRVVVSH